MPGGRRRRGAGAGATCSIRRPRPGHRCGRAPGWRIAASASSAKAAGCSAAGNAAASSVSAIGPARTGRWWDPSRRRRSSRARPAGRRRPRRSAGRSGARACGVRTEQRRRPAARRRRPAAPTRPPHRMIHERCRSATTAAWSIRPNALGDVRPGPLRSARAPSGRRPNWGSATSSAIHAARARLHAFGRFEDPGPQDVAVVEQVVERGEDRWRQSRPGGAGPAHGRRGPAPTSRPRAPSSTSTS